MTRSRILSIRSAKIIHPIFIRSGTRKLVERDMEISNPLRYADELDEKFHAQTAALEAAGIHVETWAWESHERAETAVYDALPEKIGIEPDLKPQGCAEKQSHGKTHVRKSI